MRNGPFIYRSLRLSVSRNDRGSNGGWGVIRFLVAQHFNVNNLFARTGEGFAFFLGGPRPRARRVGWFSAANDSRKRTATLGSVATENTIN